MKEDAQETRVVAKNWREYLKESGESYRVYSWAWKEFVTPESRKWMKRAVAALLVMIGLQMVEPLLVRGAIDGLVVRDGSKVIRSLLTLGGIMVVSRLFNWAFDHFREYAIGIDQGRLDVRSTELFFEKSLSQHTQDTGYLNAASVEKGRGRVLEVQHMMVFDAVPVLMEMVVAYACLFIFAPVGGFAMVALLGVYTAFMLFVNRRVVEVCTPIDAELRKFNRYRVERWENIERVKTNGKEREEVAHMSAWWNRIIEKDRSFWLWYIRIVNYRGQINVLMTACMFGYGMWQVWDGLWSVGLLYPFYMWISVISRNIWRISQIEHRLNWAMPSVRAMKIALTLKPDVLDAPDAVELPADRSVGLELRGVGHAYGLGSEEAAAAMHVLADVSFKVAPGEKVALLGPSGAGKTTVMKLVQRFSDAARGQILVDGRDLRDVKLGSWQRLVGYISQQAQVLDGTLRYNLLYGLTEEERAKVSDEELWRVMRILQIDFGERLSEGLDTMVGKRGVRLSGGQAQRLMIGAAVLKKPRFMIIDEATSSLDSTTEKAVQEGLAKLLPAETSVLIITHRLSTVRKLCTKFVVLRPAAEAARDHGPQVEAEAPSYEELYSKSATFRRIADDQDVKIAA